MALMEMLALRFLQHANRVKLQTTTSTDMATETASGQHMTILRIKRKRTDEPLDALCMSSGTKGSL